MSQLKTDIAWLRDVAKTITRSDYADGLTRVLDACEKMEAAILEARMALSTPFIDKDTLDAILRAGLAKHGDGK